MDSFFKIIYEAEKVTKEKDLLWGISPDTFFTVFITLATFVLGYIVNRAYELKKERDRLKELEEYFRKLVELLEKPLTRQKESLQKLTKQLKEQKEHQYNLDDVSNFNVTLLREIDTKDLYTIFIKNKKGETSLKTELFRNLIGSIQHLDNLKKSIVSNFESLHKLKEYHTVYKENIVHKENAFLDMSNQNPDIFLKRFDQIRLNWFALGKNGVAFKDCYVARKFYLEPAMELCQQNKYDPRATFILKHIFECIHACDNMEGFRRIYRELFVLSARGLQKGMIDIKKSLAEFEKM